jgi:hypothetical protein
MTIHSIIGLMNSGKTLFMTYCLYDCYKKGYTILSNYNLNFPHYRINQDYILYLSQHDRDLNNIVFGFDEFWIWLSESRSAMTKENKLTSYMFNQSSKGKTIIFLTAQRNSQNENRIRENQHLLSLCTREVYDSGMFKKISDEHRVLPDEYQNKLYIRIKTLKQKLNGLESFYTKKQEMLIHAKTYFKLYNTNEVIISYQRK